MKTTNVRRLEVLHVSQASLIHQTLSPTTHKKIAKRRKRTAHKNHHCRNRRKRRSNNREFSEDSSAESEDNDSSALVQQLLKATGLSNRKKKGKKDFLPHLYVIKNEPKDVVNKFQHGTNIYTVHLKCWKTRTCLRAGSQIYGDIS